MFKILYQLFVLVSISQLISFTVSAEELNPRTYKNIPINQNFAGLAYIYTDGDIYTSADVPLDNVKLKVDGEILAYARTFGLFGNLSKFDVALGHACGDASAIDDNNEKLHRSFCGLLDTKVRLSYNFFGAPALTMKEYIKTPQDLVIGASLLVSIPTGEYQKDYILNSGANRWYFKPEIGLSFPWRKWEVDVSFGVKFFTDNHDLKRTQTFEQDPIYNFQLHFVYDIIPGQWIAFNTNYFGGGDTYVDGKKSGIKKQNHRAGVTYNFAITRTQNVKLYANTGVTTRLGNDSDAYGISWSYRWE